jgi:mannose-6-phosphate isomerase-like protein (cupin superfamily)
MHIVNLQNVERFNSDHGESVAEMVGLPTNESNGSHSLAHIVIAPGKSCLKHYHPECEESYYILSGKGEMIIEDESRTLQAGDCVFIPSKKWHQIINSSHTENLVFIAVCAKAWNLECSVFE